MSYYRPSFSDTITMSRGRGGGYSSRGSYRGSSRGHRGHSSRGSGRFDSNFSNSFDSSRSKYGSGGGRGPGGGGRGSGSGDRYMNNRHDDFRKSSYRGDSSYSSTRDGGHRSPDRKRSRNEAPSSRHDSSYGSGYGGSSRYEASYSERRSFSSDRHPSSFSRKDEFRKPPHPPRGGYRGRINSRGSRGLKTRERSNRRRLVDSSYAVRKRVIPPRSSDNARKLKILKLRSAIAARKRRVVDDKDEFDEEDKIDALENDDKEDGDEMNKEDDVNNQEVSPKKSENKQDGAASEKDEKKGEKPEDPAKKTFIKLNCPHCGIKAVTFRKYDLHLQGKTHVVAMRNVALKQKSILAQMRQAQRNAQNELEKSADFLSTRTNFCPLCKLNYKQKKSLHQNSEAHKNMKKFLMPSCKVCSLTFTSPMMYESHCCSIEHLKRKQRVDNGDSDEFDEENNLENFTTIDSVGIDGEGSEEDDKKDVKEPVSVGIEQIRKIEAYYCDLCKMYVGRVSDELINPILTRHCKQRTHMQRYIRYQEDKDLEKRAEKLQRKETAEKEGKEKQEKDTTNTTAVTAVKEEIHEAKEVKDEEEKPSVTIKAADEDEARDDKLWADVDKDLDDILSSKEEVEANSDDEEDQAAERYGRFKSNGDDKQVKKADEGGVNMQDGAKNITADSEN